MSHDALNNRLMVQFGFSADELAANRAGRLSDGQRERIRLRLGGIARDRRRLVLQIGAIFLVVYALGSLVRGRFLDVLPLLIAVVTLGALAAFGFASFRYSARDLRSGTFSAAEGEATARMYEIGTRAGRKMTYELNIGERTFFRENEAELAAFERGYHYRVYYMHDAPAHLILSAEALDR